MNGPWGRSELMVYAAVQYCLGRQTYIVGDCADWLIEHWNDFGEHTRKLIQRDVEEAFDRDDKAREVDIGWFPLGGDCDRRQWERVRSLWRQSDGPST